MNGGVWICPECGERFFAALLISINTTDNTHTIRLDDDAIRKHLDMHEACYCRWVNVYAVCSDTAIAYQRDPDPLCPVHKDADHRARVLTQRLAAGLDIPIELIQDTPPEEKA